MAERDYLPLILFSAILSTLCTFARNIIDYQQIVLCRQSQRASALRLPPSALYLHPSALVCTAAIAVQMVQAGGENGCATRVSRHRGSGRPIGATENPLPLCRFPLCYHSARWLCTSACADGSVGELWCCLH